MKLKKPVVYIEDKDFTSNGPKPYLKKFVLLIQGSFCGHCHHFLPVYQSVANKFQDKLLFTTIQVDGSPPQQQLAQLIRKWVPFNGVPYLVFYVNGEYKVYNGDRSESSVMEFISLYNK